MFDPVELQLSPSCYNCLTWSADGELAIAAGEYVHILTPKTSRQHVDVGASRKPTSWQFTRFRANLFTNREWPTLLPQNRENFSIGAEQSISTVAALSWSPPGLAKHSRCLLAVLTSNLVLSLYEPTGLPGKWPRTAIVNDALEEFYSPSINEQGLKLRKSRIRSFAWCPTIKSPAMMTGVSLGAMPQSTKWGNYLLAVANDDNDLIFLLVKRERKHSVIERPYTIDVLSAISPCETGGSYPMVRDESLFSTAVRSRTRVSHIACGPWIADDDRDGAALFKAVVALVLGSELRVVDLNAAVIVGSGHKSGFSKAVKLRAVEQTLPIMGLNPEIIHFTGPVQWMSQGSSECVCLTVGVSFGRGTVTMSNDSYVGGERTPRNIKFRWRKFMREAIGGGLNSDAHTLSQHWEPISAMTVAVGDDENDPATLHLGTMNAWDEAFTCPTLQEEGSIIQSGWIKHVDDFRERFDIDHDLGGLAVARVWGLAAYRGCVVAAFTMHPGDMIEYATAAEERTTLVFSPAMFQPGLDHRSCLFWEAPRLGRDTIYAGQERVLDFTLGLYLQTQSSDMRFDKLAYAAACCAIIAHRADRLLSLAREALQQLSLASDVDLTEELSKCEMTIMEPTITAKSAAQFTRSGSDVFERCEICGSGIEWYSSREAQCAEGHLSVRCALTFLAIQDPEITKICSVCESEYLDEESYARLPPEEQQQQSLPSLSWTVFEFFDTCVYCQGKFQDP